MSATQHSDLVKALAEAMLDSYNGVTVPASWGPRVSSEQTRRTRMAAARLVEKLADRTVLYGEVPR